MKKIIVFVSALVIVAIFVVAVFLFRQPTSQPQEEEQAAQERQNAIEDEIPDLNPTANTNPFSGSYKNPFE